MGEDCPSGLQPIGLGGMPRAGDLSTRQFVVREKGAWRLRLRGAGSTVFLTRFFLWQYFYQMLYSMIPIMALAWWLKRLLPSKRTMSAAGSMEHGAGSRT
jgi:hypothetical protein